MSEKDVKKAVKEVKEKIKNGHHLSEAVQSVGNKYGYSGEQKAKLLKLAEDLKPIND